MRIVHIEPLENGAHINQTSDNLSVIPNGWAVIPEELVTENFPFGDLTTEEIDGVMTVTSWTPGVIPELEPVPEVEDNPSTSELIDILLGVNTNE
jgi:hypothetical protein